MSAQDHFRIAVVLFYGIFEGISGLVPYQIIILNIVCTTIINKWWWLFWGSVPVAIVVCNLDRPGVLRAFLFVGITVIAVGHVIMCVLRE